jgi:hypothetical protein
MSPNVRRTLIGIVGAALAWGALFIVAAAPVAAGSVTCTYAATPGHPLDLPDTVLGPGEVACGGSGDDYVFRIDGGVFYGHGGNDAVVDINSGVFRGGRGDDVVGNDILEGQFYGGEGNDHAYYMAGGTGLFKAGRGNDSLTIFNWGTYLGNKGYDTVCSVNPDPTYATYRSVEGVGVC